MSVWTMFLMIWIVVILVVIDLFLAHGRINDIMTENEWLREEIRRLMSKKG